MERRWIVLLASLSIVFARSQPPLPKLHFGSYEMLFSHEVERSTGTKVPLIPSSNTLFPEVEATKEVKSKTAVPKRREETGSAEVTTSVESTTVTVEGTTTETLCLDFDENCEKMLPLCDNPLYHIMTTKKCAKSCNKCDEFARLPYALRCKDTLKSCSERMCESDFYDVVYKKQKCAKTCGFC